MKGLKDYKINYTGLSIGQHQFDFKIDADFLTHFEDAPIKEVDLTIDLALERDSCLIELHFDLYGSIQANCDICLEEFSQAVELEEHYIVKFVEEAPQDPEIGILYVNRNDSFIDVAECIYEMILMAIPMRTVHPLDENGDCTCNPDFLSYLSNTENLETDKPGNISEEKSENVLINPIWKELEKLKKR